VFKSHGILWGEGMFLRPQHFQQQALYTENRFSEVLRGLRNHVWGIRSASFDLEALKLGQIRPVELSLLFQDGCSLDAPGHAPLPLERNLADIPGIGIETTLYAVLPFLNAYGSNCADQASGSARPSRYRTERTVLTDLFTTAHEAEVTLLHPHVRLMVEEENRDGQLSLPLARLRKTAAGSWQIDEDYIPPLLHIGASPLLERLLKRLLDILQVKHQALTAIHRERAKNVAEFGTTDIASFWLLHTVNRNFPLLAHFSRERQSAPEALYTALAQMAGELITFSTSHTLSDIPAYRHESLTEIFATLDALIHTLLDTVISARYAVIPLSTPKPSFFVGHLESERLIDGVDYYLSVESELPAAELLDSLPFRLKIGAPDDVEKILNSALPGVKLAHATRTPSALPVRVGNHYFAFEPHGQIFERMQKARSICIYVPQTLSALKLELIAVFR
jgi:type VI secretion system protein ImpJ